MPLCETNNMSAHVKIIRATGEELINTHIPLNTLNLTLYKLVEKHFTTTALFDKGKLLDSTQQVKQDVCLVAHEAYKQGKLKLISFKYCRRHSISYIQPLTRSKNVHLTSVLYGFDRHFLVTGPFGSHICDWLSDKNLTRSFFLPALCVDKQQSAWNLTADAFV